MLKINIQLFAEQAGYINEVYVLAGSSAMAAGTGAKILGVDKASYGNLCDMLEITSFGDTYKKRMGGLKDTTISISGNIYTGDTTGQAVLIPGATIFIGCFPQGRLVASMQVAAIVESFEASYDVGGKQTFSCGLSCIAAPVALPARSA